MQLSHLKSQLILLSLLSIWVPLYSQSISGLPDNTVEVGGFYSAISMENDNFGASLADDWDDLRTYSFDLEVYPAREYNMTCTYDSLTNRDSAENQGRIDELTLTVGRTVVEYTDEDGVMWGNLLLGAGTRFCGNIGGEGIQHFWHNLTGVKRDVHLPYDELISVGVLIYLKGKWAMRSDLNLVDYLPFVPPGYCGVSLCSSALASTAGELQGAADLMLLFEGSSTLASAGVGYLHSAAEIDSLTFREVNEYETGLWLLWSAHVGGFFTDYGFQLSDGIARGAFGFSFGDFSYHESRSAHWVLINEVGLTLPPLVFINQLRWQPKAFLESDSICSHLLMTFDYRSGNGTRYQYPENIVKIEQFSTGLCFQLFRLKKGLQANPFVTTLIGLRHEGLFPQLNERSRAFERAAFPVLHGELGLRISFGPVFSHWQDVLYSLAVGIDGFVQFPFLQLDTARFYGSDVARDLKVSFRFAALALD
jgi:hypothetical protein